MAQAGTTPSLPVLIFGSHITALGVLRVLVGRGIPRYVLDATSDIIVRSRWYRPTERTLAETSDSDELGRLLQSLHLPGAVLIACSDAWTLAVAGLDPEIRQRFPVSVAPREVIEQFLDKDRFRALADRLGIPYPRTLALRGPADLDQTTDDDLANGFLKPTDSQRHHLVFGTKGSFVRSRAEATRLVELASAAGITFVLQDWDPRRSVTELPDRRLRRPRRDAHHDHGAPSRPHGPAQDREQLGGRHHPPRGRRRGR